MSGVQLAIASSFERFTQMKGKQLQISFQVQQYRDPLDAV